MPSTLLGKFIATGVSVPLVVCALFYTTSIARGGKFMMDPRGKEGAFEPFLAKYIRVAEFIIGLASGSIVLLIGSSALHPGAKLPLYYASPLLLLALCVFYGITFIVWLILQYEADQHGMGYSRLQYIITLTLGFSSLICFFAGYLMLILGVTI